MIIGIKPMRVSIIAIKAVIRDVSIIKYEITKAATAKAIPTA
jgi:hypothetical protein